ncbi:NAD(P)-binding protein [Durotheca rogersii]|uniref:NAD(P)-binding protein n=1 Tax=Durotheca rogersii TaxID=419775 RepID=UPI002220CBB3|nr:NAD(P)-binding protein [Durotheca rogersii]KAI5865420.1 NAD(P)-binding protein [Durotheca rogersii]
MKLIVTGATGCVGREVIRQSLSRKEITSVIALARGPVPVPDGLGAGADSSKLRSIRIKDYGEYPDDVRRELAGAGACIWTVGVTPDKALRSDWKEVERVCRDCTIAGMNAMYDAGPSRPFRFLYVSGEAAERDQTKKPAFLSRYLLMRGEVENQVLKFAAEHDGFEAVTARPAFIYEPGEFLKAYLVGPLARLALGAPSMSSAEVAKALLEQVIAGFGKDPLRAWDLVRLSKATE